MNTPEFIEMKLKNAKLNVQNVTIIFIANVQGISTNIADYSDSSVLTEFLSMEEYNELLNACQDFGFYTLTYFEVNEFVKDYLCGKFKNTKLILFEGTQKGTGRGKGRPAHDCGPERYRRPVPAAGSRPGNCPAAGNLQPDYLQPGGTVRYTVLC